MVEGRPRVRLMQQGAPTVTPVEVRIVGTNPNELQRIGDLVQQILADAPGSDQVYTNFHEDYYGVGLYLRPEANQPPGDHELRCSNSQQHGFFRHPGLHTLGGR